jgi:hypothetical protein
MSMATSEKEPAVEELGLESAEDSALRQALDRIEEEFGKGGPKDLSDEARAALLDAHAEFLEDLGVEAVRAAKRGGLDTVSARHIDEAHIFIQSGSESKVIQGFATFGGVLAGAGAGQFLAVLSEKDPSNLGYALATIFLVVGFLFIAGAWSKNRR